MVAVGKLKRRIRIERNDPVQNAGGPGESDSWGLLMTVWGSLVKTSGARLLDAGDIRESNRFEAFVWYRKDLHDALLSGTDPRECRLVVGTREFTIDNWDVVNDDVEKQIRFLVNERR